MPEVEDAEAPAAVAGALDEAPTIIEGGGVDDVKVSVEDGRVVNAVEEEEDVVGVGVSEGVAVIVCTEVWTVVWTEVCTEVCTFVVGLMVGL